MCLHLASTNLPARSDIEGARPTTSPTRFFRPSSSLDFSDVPCTQPRLRGSSRSTLPPSTLTTAGIPGASPLTRTNKEIVSPGRGTLCAADIPGAGPGAARKSEQLPATWALGRYPMPATPAFAFNMQVCRVPCAFLQLSCDDHVGGGGVVWCACLRQLVAANSTPKPHASHANCDVIAFDWLQARHMMLERPLAHTVTEDRRWK